MSRPRVVFMGTPAFAVPALEAVAEACDVTLVVTQPDRPKGRGLALAESEVATAAARIGVREIYKPADARTAETLARVRAAAPDLAAVVAFGAILPAELLAAPRLGCINLHGSLLPDYRGASPVQRALWDGRAMTGVTTMWMDEGIDTGDLILQRCEPIRAEDDAGSLATRLANVGAPLLAESLLAAHAGNAARAPQDRTAGSYARKLKKRDGAMDWTLDAIALWNRARAVTPWPGAFTEGAGRRLVVTRATPIDVLEHAGEPGQVVAVDRDGVRVLCGRGVLRLERVKPEGRAEMAAADWAHGARIAPGSKMRRMEEVQS
ncbi:MAG: methionyl-tRNA formyltransferase [Candidatus Eisenbacteria bacterium]|uniref:Methionyl-tRNA formyltransferase n=1 Tax=Eiseniibacteriota bacterium TaxID=2212470 RepID=A0A849SI60_UNCEI|nr:methionyl-tRNA formyltransferase [Candidatus Eisenbacteria bacterium]